MEKLKKLELATIKAEKEAVKDAKRMCIDENINLYDYTTEALIAYGWLKKHPRILQRIKNGV